MRNHYDTTVDTGEDHRLIDKEAGAVITATQIMGLTNVTPQQQVMTIQILDIDELIYPVKEVLHIRLVGSSLVLKTYLLH